MDIKDRANWTHTLWEPLDKMKQSPLHSKKEGIRVAAYCRISGGDTNFRSLENQVSYFSNYIYKRKNWKCIGIYIDERKSGATMSKRPGIQRLIRHARSGEVDLILTKSIARFSRNTKEILEVIQELKETNTVIYFDREGIEIFRGNSSLMLETHAAMAQDFIENISNLVKFTYRKRLNEGRPMFGDMYGYDYVSPLEKDKVKINEEEAKVVRLIFDEFINGATYADISRLLNESGIKTKKGKSYWSGSIVRKVIQKIEYTGSKVAMKRSKNLLTGKVSEKDSTQEKFLITDTHPAIISVRTFEEAQKRVGIVSVEHKNKLKSTKNSLRNRMFCGRCGSKIQRQGPYNFICKYSEASVNLCDAERLKTFDPNAMVFRALFRRMMGIEIIVMKHRNKISYEIYDELNRDSKKLEIEFQEMLNELKNILEEVNENDHFEFHRLRLFTKLEIAGIKQDFEEVDRLKKEYKNFENKASKIEEDREYRMLALSWLKNVCTIEGFIKNASIDILRAWMFNIIVYSRTAFEIEWIDGEVTVIEEKEIEKIKKRTLVRNQEREKYQKLNILKSSQLQEISNNNIKLADYEFIIERKEANSMSIQTAEKNVCGEDYSDKDIKADVIKLADGLSIKDLGNLKKNILKNKFEIMQKNENRKLKVAAYCRVSTHLEEQKLSLQTQLAYYNFKILSTPNWEFAGIYADEGLSGTKTEHRDDFNRMIEDAKHHRIEMIITKSVSRFSRNVLDVLEIVKMLNELEPSVSIFFEKEQIRSDDPHATMLLSLMATAAQEEVQSLSNSITWGIQSLAKRGTISRITDIYGYTIDKDRTWRIVNEEASVVKMIYEFYAEGYSIYQIIECLKDKDITSPTGKAYWDYNTIRAMLRNEKYIGDYEFQKFYTPNEIGAKSRVNDGKVPKFYIEKHHDPIIDKQIYEDVQKRIEMNKKELSDEMKKGGTAGRSSYYKVFTCSECGHLITRYKSNTYDSKEGSQWRCVNSSKNVGSSCEGITLTEKYIDYNFFKVLLKIKKNKKFKHMVEIYLKKVDLSIEEIKDKKRLEKEMKLKNQQLYEAVDTELQKDGKNTKLINQITSDIIELRNQQQVYVKRLEKLAEDRKRLENLIKFCEKLQHISFENFHNMRPRINPGESLYLTSKNARNSSYMNIEGEDRFPEDCFNEYVLSGSIAIDGKIKYKFADEIKFGIDMTYKDYQKEFNNGKEKIQFEELLKSKEVQIMKTFCTEKKSPKEIRAHLGIKSKVSFDKRFIKPLCAAGKLKLERGKAVYEWWYTWSDDSSRK